jgi:hypothetical protein
VEESASFGVGASIGFTMSMVHVEGEAQYKHAWSSGESQTSTQTSMAGVEFEGAFAGLPEGTPDGYNFQAKMAVWETTLEGDNGAKEEVYVVGYLTNCSELVPPALPEDVYAYSATDTSITWAWSPASGTSRPADRYEIFRSIDGKGTYGTEPVATVDAQGINYWTDYGLAPGTNYSYKFRTVSENSNGTFKSVLSKEYTAHTQSSADSTPTITSQPVSKAFSHGENVALTVTATPTATDQQLHYQWYKYSRKTGWVAIEGGTAATLTLNSITVEESGVYHCEVYEWHSGIGYSTYSNAATITVDSQVDTQTVSFNSRVVTQPASLSAAKAAPMKATAVASYATNMAAYAAPMDTDANASYSPHINIAVSDVNKNIMKNGSELTAEPGDEILAYATLENITLGANDEVRFYLFNTDNHPVPFYINGEGDEKNIASYVTASTTGNTGEYEAAFFTTHVKGAYHLEAVVVEVAGDIASEKFASAGYPINVGVLEHGRNAVKINYTSNVHFAVNSLSNPEYVSSHYTVDMPLSAPHAEGKTFLGWVELDKNGEITGDDFVTAVNLAHVKDGELTLKAIFKTADVGLTTDGLAAEVISLIVIGSVGGALIIFFLIWFVIMPRIKNKKMKTQEEAE